MKTEKLPPYDNLAVCPDHGIMTHCREGNRKCPLCMIDDEIEVRRDADVGGEPINQQEVRQRLEAETVAELLPLMKEYVEDRFEGELWLTVERFDGKLPAGYSEAQERWVNIIGYRTGSVEKFIVDDPSASQTIETLREEGYGGGSDE